MLQPDVYNPRIIEHSPDNNIDASCTFRFNPASTGVKATEQSSALHVIFLIAFPAN
jgi:hypothetical protein